MVSPQKPPVNPLGQSGPPERDHARRSHAHTRRCQQQQRLAGLVPPQELLHEAGASPPLSAAEGEEWRRPHVAGCAPAFRLSGREALPEGQQLLTFGGEAVAGGSVGLAIAK